MATSAAESARERFSTRSISGRGKPPVMVDKADELDPHTREKARFYIKQIAGALSPTNFVATNPELLRETMQQNGENLVRGMIPSFALCTLENCPKPTISDPMPARLFRKISFI